MDKKPSIKKTVAADPVPSVRRSLLWLELKHPLAQGDIGGQVHKAQDALFKLGFDDFKINGRFGSVMSKAVRRFQESRGLRITGEIDSRTWESLFQPDVNTKIKE
jgi:peptidoglycan hydrolase-like protein with peptidoglycan-binding domain